MQASVFHGPGDIRVEQVPDPAIRQPTDAIVRITHACICGSDLWFYRGVARWQPGWRTGHEFIGVVEDVGEEVELVNIGDVVIAPFAYSDGTCEFCRKYVYTSCINGGYWGGADDDGGQGEAARVPLADGTLVAIPEAAASDDRLIVSMLPLTDVMGTGHHAAVSAEVRPGTTAAVIGDGAVGLCAVLAARRLGADRIVVLGHHDERLGIARRFGATDVVSARGEEAAEEVAELTGGGAPAVLECVGTQESVDIAAAIARPGGSIGFVGVPHEVESIDLARLFSDNIALRGGVAPVRGYIGELMRDVIRGTLDPSPVLDLTVDLDGVPEGYAAMDSRRALKVMVRP